MGWGRLDDGFHRHRKRRRVQLAADGLLARAISHAADEESDGYVDLEWVAEQFRGPDRRRRKAVLAELVAENILEPVQAGDTVLIAAAGRPVRAEPCTVNVGPVPADGFIVHDFLDFNLSARELAAERNAAAKRQRDRRQRGRQAALPWETGGATA